MTQNHHAGSATGIDVAGAVEDAAASLRSYGRIALAERLETAIARATPQHPDLDTDVEELALKHIARSWHSQPVALYRTGEYKKTEQFRRLKAFAVDLLARRATPQHSVTEKASIDHDAFWVLIAKLNRATPGAAYKQASAELVSYIMEWTDARAQPLASTAAQPEQASQCSGCDPAEGFCKACRQAERTAASEQQAGAVHQAKVESGNWKDIEADQLERYSDVFTVRTLYAALDIATTAADQQEEAYSTFAKGEHTAADKQGDTASASGSIRNWLTSVLRYGSHDEVIAARQLRNAFDAGRHATAAIHENVEHAATVAPAASTSTGWIMGDSLIGGPATTGGSNV